jgi:hypothetical protein
MTLGKAQITSVLLPEMTSQFGVFLESIIKSSFT